jgi:hypothetical protein
MPNEHELPAVHRAQRATYTQLSQTLLSFYTTGIRALRSDLFEGINGPTGAGLTAFPVAVAIWESYIDFTFFSPFARIYFGHENYQKALEIRKEIEKISLKGKTLLMPLFLFGTKFDISAQPFQDFDILLRIRNQIVHDSIHKEPTKEVETLRRKGLCLKVHEYSVYHWQQDVTCLEVIRWCINTINSMSVKLSELCQPCKAQPILWHITEKEAKEWIRAHVASGTHFNSRWIYDLAQQKRCKEKSTPQRKKK